MTEWRTKFGLSPNLTMLISLSVIPCHRRELVRITTGADLHCVFTALQQVTIINIRHD